MVNDGKGHKIHCPQTIEAVRKYLDPKATEFFSEGKRKYLMPMDKKMRKQIMPLAKPYPKKDEDWQKIDRNIFKKKEDERTKLETEHRPNTEGIE